MALITTGNHPKALWPGIKAWWGRKYGEHTVEYTALFDMESSSRHYEEDVEVTGFGLAPVKAQGAAVAYDDEAQGTISRYVHVAYALGYIVTKEELDDNLYEVVSRRRSQALAFSMRQTKEQVAALVYNRAFTAGFVGGDGVVLGSNAHPSIAGNQSNILAVAADLSEASLEDMCTLIMQAQNSRGLKISLMPRSLIIPVQEWWNANRILKSVQQSGTANNDPNVLKMTNALPEGIKLNHYLTDTDAWFVRTNAPRGMIGYDRVPIQFTKDTDFDTENAKAKCYERYVFGWTDWRGIYCTPGA
jgi:hypothetical protein